MNRSLMTVSLALAAIAGCASTAEPGPDAEQKPSVGAIALEGSDADGPPILMWRFWHDDGPISYALALPDGVKSETKLIPARAAELLSGSDAFVYTSLFPGEAIDPKVGESMFKNRGMLEGGQTLADLLPKSTFERAAARLGPAMQMLGQMRPWVVGAFVEMQIANKAKFKPALDIFVGRASGIPERPHPEIAHDLAYGLLETLSYLSPDDEVAFLNESLDALDRDPKADQTREARWLTGDAEDAWTHELSRQEADGPQHAKLQRVMRKQARVMVNRAVHSDLGNKAVFVAAPLGTLMDDDGLLLTLVRAGVQVEQLRARSQ